MIHKPLMMICILVVMRAAAFAEERYVDYLYMEPNEGGSSAGHVAVAFDERTYAFQRSPEGRLVLERDPSEHVWWLYAVLGNRAVHRTRVAVPEDAFERLREGFNRRWLVQQGQLALVARLDRAARLLALLSERAHGATGGGIPIEGAGYFATDGTSPILATLAADLARAHGAGFAADRCVSLRAELGGLALAPSPPPAPPTPDHYPAGGDAFAERYSAAMAGIVALDTLARAPALDPASILTVDDAPLDAAERAALARYADALRIELVRLAASARADAGHPLLIGMARLAALEQSLATGRLVVLDALPEDARRVPHAALARTLDAARALRDDACEDLRARRRRFVAITAPAERDYGRLENAANRCVELARGLAENRDVRVARDTLVPARAGTFTGLVVPRADAAALAEAARAAAATARTYARAVDDLYRYDLVRRNCVTEAFATIDAILGPDTATALGGGTATGGARIVPALANRAVRRDWRVVASETTPSYRRARVDALARTGNPLAVRLRESNVLTSTVYRPSRDDSTFLFFTDDVLLLRPLLGAANLGVGVGASLVGLARAPLDRGSALESGLRSVLWSLPELVFVNVRKGSFDHVSRHALPTAPPSRENPPPSPR
jgi:hypothetical protein